MLKQYRQLSHWSCVSQHSRFLRVQMQARICREWYYVQRSAAPLGNLERWYPLLDYIYNQGFNGARQGVWHGCISLCLNDEMTHYGKQLSTIITCLVEMGCLSVWALILTSELVELSSWRALLSAHSFSQGIPLSGDNHFFNNFLWFCTTFWLHFQSPDVDECSMDTHDCHDNATCFNRDGSHVCECDEGFSGNGANCTGMIFIQIKRPHSLLVFQFQFTWYRNNELLTVPLSVDSTDCYSCHKWSKIKA